MNTKQVTCNSGVIGYQCLLRENYIDYDEWVSYSETYGLARRLGFDSEKEAWEANPTIQGSVVPSDFRVVSDIELSELQAHQH